MHGGCLRSGADSSTSTSATRAHDPLSSVTVPVTTSPGIAPATKCALPSFLATASPPCAIPCGCSSIMGAGYAARRLYGRGRRYLRRVCQRSTTGPEHRLSIPSGMVLLCGHLVRCCRRLGPCPRSHEAGSFTLVLVHASCCDRSNSDPGRIWRVALQQWSRASQFVPHVLRGGDRHHADFGVSVPIDHGEASGADLRHLAAVCHGSWNSSLDERVVRPSRCVSWGDRVMDLGMWAWMNVS